MLLISTARHGHLTLHFTGGSDVMPLEGDAAARAAPDGPESRAIFYPTRPNTQELYHQTEDLCKSGSKSAPVNCLAGLVRVASLVRLQFNLLLCFGCCLLVSNQYFPNLVIQKLFTSIKSLMKRLHPF